ncbi:MAG: hypothetical protein WBC91_09025 [Phototrophicaceae bacterium]
MPEPIEHISRDDGIQEIIFHAADATVIDLYLKIVESLLLKTINDEAGSVLRVLLNLTQTDKIPPFSHIIQKARTLLKTYAKSHKAIQIRVAVLVPKKELTTVSLLEVFSQLLPIDAKLKSFEEEARDAAITWILTVN